MCYCALFNDADLILAFYVKVWLNWTTWKIGRLEIYQEFVNNFFRAKGKFALLCFRGSDHDFKVNIRQRLGTGSSIIINMQQVAKAFFASWRRKELFEEIKKTWICSLFAFSLELSEVRLPEVNLKAKDSNKTSKTGLWKPISIRWFIII